MNVVELILMTFKRHYFITLFHVPLLVGKHLQVQGIITAFQAYIKRDCKRLMKHCIKCLSVRVTLSV